MSIAIESRDALIGASVVDSTPSSRNGDLGFTFKSRRFDETIAASRIAARSNAAQVGEPERRALLKERAELLTRRMLAPLSQEESNRLQYVRWSLDRIDDARHGGELDALQSEISRYREALSDISNLRGVLTKHLPKKKKA